MTFSLVIGWLIFGAVTAYPVDVICRTYGKTRLWTIAMFVHPALIFVFIWCFAYPNKWDEFLEAQK